MAIFNSYVSLPEGMSFIEYLLAGHVLGEACNFKQFYIWHDIMTVGCGLEIQTANRLPKPYKMALPTQNLVG